MKKTAWLAVMVVAIGFSLDVSARDRSGGGYAYDYQSGNSYSSSGSGYRGYSSNTGSTWSSNSSGSRSSGMDSKGNSWTYDRNSGVYQNYGTGESRYHGQRR